MSTNRPHKWGNKFVLWPKVRSKIGDESVLEGLQMTQSSEEDKKLEDIVKNRTETLFLVYIRKI